MSRQQMGERTAGEPRDKGSLHWFQAKGLRNTACFPQGLGEQIVDESGETISTITFSPMTIIIYILSMIYFMIVENSHFSAQEIVIAQLLNG